jgi:hypothetical protein
MCRLFSAAFKPALAAAKRPEREVLISVYGPASCTFLYFVQP